MLKVIITSVVANIGYRFDVDGKLYTHINLLSPVTLPTGESITKLDTSCIKNANELALGPGDMIECSIDTTGCEIRILSVGSERQQALLPHICPSCGSRLLTIDGQNCCINRSCPAQMTNNILMFLSCMGMVFDARTGQVLDILLGRGALPNPASLFSLPLDELMTLPGITTLEAQLFQRYVHSIRGGRIGMFIFLRSLRIPTWTDVDHAAVAQIFTARKWDLRHVGNLNIDKVRKLLPKVNWVAWDTFLSIPANKYLVAELSEILYN